jgi:hypothetical protein
MFKLKFDCNSELNPTKRIQLFDWLEDLSNYHCCSQETLILTFQLIDFYCTKSIVSLKEYQLIGAGCLSLASKNNESFTRISLDSLVYYALNAYTKQELLDIELRILSTLDWNVNLNQISLELIGLNPPTKIYQLGSDLLVIVLKGITILSRLVPCSKV